MRISLNWLQELVDINLTPEQLAETLTMAGFEVEEIEDRRTWADGVVLGKIQTADHRISGTGSSGDNGDAAGFSFVKIIG